MKQLIYFTLICLGLSGCATKLPHAITEAPTPNVTARQAQAEPAKFSGLQVRWGGEVIEVLNQASFTEVLVLGRDLKTDGQPEINGEVDARFVARFAGFLDPAQLTEGKRITVSGSFSGVEERKVGEYPYPYPVVKVKDYHLWPEPLPRHYYPYPYYDPWWGYYGPYWRRPYWGPPYYWR